MMLNVFIKLNIIGYFFGLSIKIIHTIIAQGCKTARYQNLSSEKVDYPFSIESPD